MSSTVKPSTATLPAPRPAAVSRAWGRLPLLACLISGITLVKLASAEDALRPEVAKHLQAASELMQKGRNKDALAQVAEADGVAGRTAAESFTIERMRGSIAAAAGDNALAAKSFEIVVNSNKLPPADQLKTIEALGGLYYRTKDYGKSANWVERYLKEGGTDPAMRQLLAQDYYLAGDYGNASKELQNEISATVQAGKAPAEDRLQMLLACQQRQKDSSGFVQTMEKLVNYYPKKEYWSDFIHRVESRPGFADRLQIDLFRFKLAHGFVNQPAQVMEFSQLALQAGFPSLAKTVMDDSFASGLIGKGSTAEREKRLQVLVESTLKASQSDLARNTAEARDNRDGSGLINLGLQLVDSGDSKAGLALAEEGFRKGNFRHPDDARLRLAELYIQTRQDAKAGSLLKSVSGTDGAADVAHLWLLQTRSGH